MKKGLIAISLAPVAPCLLGVFKWAGLNGRVLLALFVLLLAASIVCAILQPRWLKSRISIAVLIFCWLIALGNTASFMWRVYH